MKKTNDQWLPVIVKFVFITAGALIMSGCATQERVSAGTDFQICRATVIRPAFATTAGDQEVFNQVRSRNLDCSIYMPSIMAEKDKQDANEQRGRANVAMSSAACLKNYGGQLVCAPPGGSALKDLAGQIVCGPGQCVIDNVNQIKCSTQEGGSAGLNYGQAVCIGGCVRASTAYCQRPTR